MLYTLVKALVSGTLVAMVSEAARRSPAMGALLASLPLVSVLSMVWLWRDTHDAGRMAAYVQSIFWFFLPSMPMFLLIPALLRHGVGFWPSLGAGLLTTVLLYLGMTAALRRYGIAL